MCGWGMWEPYQFAEEVRKYLIEMKKLDLGETANKDKENCPGRMQEVYRSIV